jgi:Prokaryotic Cytochrome C oxidase subunit IV
MGRALILPWLLLCAVTAVSLVIGGGGRAFAGYAVLAIAFAKAALVMFAFMDLRAAPRVLQIIAAVWLVAALGLLLAIYAGIAG